eukprot:gene4726-6824_t
MSRSNIATVGLRNQLRFALIEQGPLTSMSEADASPESVSLLSIKERHESTHSPTQVESKPPTGPVDIMSPIPHEPDLSYSDSLIISYGTGSSEVSHEAVCSAFDLPEESEFELRDIGGDQVDLGNMKSAESPLSLVVRRARRKHRSDNRVNNSPTPYEGVAEGTPFDHNSSGHIDCKFKNLVTLMPESQMRRSISLTTLQETMLPSRKRSSTISVSNPTQDTNMSMRSLETFEADYEPPKTLVVMFSAQGIGISFRKLRIAQKLALDGTDDGACHLALIDLPKDSHMPLDPVQSGIFVSSVLPGSTADIAGLQRGDMILKINDNSLDEMSIHDIHEQLASTDGDVVLLTRCIRSMRHQNVIKPLDADTSLTSISSRLLSFFGNPVDSEMSHMFEVVRRGTVSVKIEKESDGKRPFKRPWKAYMGVLRGHVLELHDNKDKLDESFRPLPSGTLTSPIFTLSYFSGGQLNVKSCLVDIAYDYKKRKYVFRLQTFNGATYLVQATTNMDMLEWINALQQNSNPDKDDAMHHDLIRRKVSQLSRPSPSIPTSSSLSSQSIHQGSRNPWSIPKLKRKSSIVEMHTSSSIRFPEPISVLCERHRVDVPLLITKLIEEVENRGLTEEGIYRQSGSSSQVQLIKERLAQAPDKTDLSDRDTFFDQHALCGALKDYFRSISPPLLTSGLYSQRLQQLVFLLRQLPEYHFSTLKCVIQHLTRVVQNSNENRMIPSNVALVFGPTLIRTDNGNDQTMLLDMNYQSKLVELLVTNYS